MRGALLRNFYLCTRTLHLPRSLRPTTSIDSNNHTNRYFLDNNHIIGNAQFPNSLPSRIRLFSSENGSSRPTPTESETAVARPDEDNNEVEDVDNKEFKLLTDDYFQNKNEDALQSILGAILKRKLSGRHEDTDDELMEELKLKPLDNVREEDIESDFEEDYKTDEEIDNLYNARPIAVKKMTAMKEPYVNTDDKKYSNRGIAVKKMTGTDPYFNMDDKKWDDMIKEAVEHGYLNDTRECEAILEDMLNWDKLLPEEIKRKVEEKFNEIGDRVEEGELEVEAGYELFKEFEDQMVLECAKLMEAEGPPQFDKNISPDNKKDLDDPPGEGPVLRWQTRVVFAPGGDAWHPKNRKVKLAVTVQELGLSKHQFMRLRELAGKRYNPGKDELMITSERFEHREENRKDCLRTLFALIEEAGKARKLVDEARISQVKERLIANPSFMQRLQTKNQVESASLSA